MERALKKYVKMINEGNEFNLNETQIGKIVNSLQNNEELWDYIDSIIFEKIEEVKGK